MNGNERITNDGRTRTNLIGDTPGRQKTQRCGVIRKEQDTLTIKIQNDTKKSKTTITFPTEYTRECKNKENLNSNSAVTLLLPQLIAFSRHFLSQLQVFLCICPKKVSDKSPQYSLSDSLKLGYKGRVS